MGLPLASFASGGRSIDKEIDLLVRRLAGHGLLEYRLGRSPKRRRTRSSSSRRLPTIGRERRRSATPTFSSCRGSPTCDGAATRWCWNRRAPARCSGFAIRRLRPPSPRCRRRNQIKQLRRQDGFPGVELLALLVDCQILFKIETPGTQQPAAGRGRRQPRSLGLSRSSVPHAQHGRPARQPAGRALSPCGRHASAAGGAAALARKEDRSAQVSAAHSQAISPVARLLRERHSTRSFDDQRPITLAELSRFLDSTARVLSRWNSRDRPRRRWSARWSLRRQALSVGGRQLRARALSGRRPMRRACPRILSLRRRRTRAGADRHPHA